MSVRPFVVLGPTPDAAPHNNLDFVKVSAHLAFIEAPGSVNWRWNFTISPGRSFG